MRRYVSGKPLVAKAQGNILLRINWVALITFIIDILKALEDWFTRQNEQP